MIGIEKVISVIEQEIKSFDLAIDDHSEECPGYANLENHLAKLEKILEYAKKLSAE